MTEVINLEFPLIRDLNKVVQIQVFIWRISNQPRLRLIGLPKIVIAFVHVGLKVSLRPNYAIYVK